ncbi:hypothetical protein HUA74_18360 [Myxococcus sp. CA051A]|uniref:hypothetical protein n=1 Tax=Myxococcus sp. CA051A TaxID=2741739 RepID=UPI00157A8005|nr:hypothetical protein [Myxococcus sp. CA051A]NTX62620.1 hypothetical protein [Myxococcus sp. CA051A]
MPANQTTNNTLPIVLGLATLGVGGAVAYALTRQPDTRQADATAAQLQQALQAAQAQMQAAQAAQAQATQAAQAADAKAQAEQAAQAIALLQAQLAQQAAAATRPQAQTAPPAQTAPKPATPSGGIWGHIAAGTGALSTILGLADQAFDLFP